MTSFAPAAPPARIATFAFVLVAAAAAGCSSKSSSTASSASASASAKSSTPTEKGPFDRLADEVCACKDEKCVNTALEAFEKNSSKDARKQDSEMTPAEKAAMDRAERCADKIAPQ